MVRLARTSGVVGYLKGLDGLLKSCSHSSHPSEDLVKAVGANGAHLVAGVSPHVTSTVNAGRCSGFEG
tara:strand:- start:262 stop:465 length:204 start_codon:yes stop_codon:yes gene_type:complete